jgi:hypothetical protein
MQRGVGRRLYAALEHAIGFGPAYTFLVLFLDRVSALDECRDCWNVGADTDVSAGRESTVRGLLVKSVLCDLEFGTKVG